MKKTVVLYPGLAVSHFVPMVQLADVLLEEGYAVVVAFIDPTLKGDIALAAVIDRAAASKPSVLFHMLPRAEDAPTFVHDSKFMVRYLEFVGRYSRHLHDFLFSMPPGSVHAVLVDMLSTEVLDVTSKLGIPAYAFFPSNASALAVSVQASSVRSEGQPSFGELGDAPLNFHGAPTMPASHLHAEMLEDPGSETFKATMDMVSRIQDANGILVNTSASIEPRAVSALSDPRSFPKMPPVYCVGPLVAGNGGQATEKHECLAWLDEQPEQSVVFLCFGSTGAGNHSKEQVKEIATGLERSGHRFLWVVRAPPHDGPEKPFDPRADPDLDALLPAGFLERTDGRGRVVKLWAPQVDVLHHAATGAFVTHCGWNSVLEGIVAGVPMLCWPLYAEQKMNKVFMVEEYAVGVEMVGWQQGLVKAEEVEAKVRLVMESEEGKQLRARVSKHKEGAAMAWKDDGSSRAAFAQFLSHASNVSRRG
ncbi:unnamed protein product [Miscanthus lutarioriparius]|uniref:Glycosyltransferase n=1 Tax=Miscanthus lutarioriparius TaxID=422564 RepID=A0A811RVJ3_9POAL|nr:unnamed protein product [Miscanthus lutarioriparius]